jgi:hypothetical protein
VIVLSVPVTPDPAVAGPFTGGQNVAQLPLHFDVVLVSGANQYKVKPLAFVSTVTPPIVLVSSVLPDAAAECVPPEPAGVLEVLELPHPVAISAAAASPTGASHLLPISQFSVPRPCSSNILIT